MYYFCILGLKTVIYRHNDGLYVTPYLFLSAIYFLDFSTFEIQVHCAIWLRGTLTPRTLKAS